MERYRGSRKDGETGSWKDGKRKDGNTESQRMMENGKDRKAKGLEVTTKP